MTKEELLKCFEEQLNKKESVVTKLTLKKFKDLKCYGKCPDIKINDTVLFFVINTVTYNGNNIKKKLKKGNIIEAYQKINENKNQMLLSRITKEYLDDPDCELYKINITKTISGLIPRFIVLESV